MQPGLLRATARVILTLLAFSVPSTMPADDESDLEKLLDRLGLTELEILHLEDKMLVQATREERVELAKELADAYVDILLASADDEEKFADYTARVRKLTGTYREADSPTLQVMLLQAEYLRAEKLITKWLENRSNTEALAEAGRILAPIVPEFQKHRTQIAVTVDRLTDELGEDDNEKLDEVREERIHQLTQVGFRATYFCGWANYYLAISLPEPETIEDNPRTSHFTDAQACFAEILGIDTTASYAEELDPDWVDLSSIWLARSLLGLGMAEIGLENEANSRVCFELLGDPLVAASLRTQNGYWQLQGWLNIGKYARAEMIANELLKEETTLSESQQSGICVSLVRAAYSQSDLSNEQLNRLGKIGLQGLMRLRRFPLLISMLNEYKAEPENSGFYSLWLNGYRTFIKAEETKNQEGYQAAAALMQKAIEMPDSGEDVKSLSICRYHLAWALFRQKDMEQAESLLQKSVPTLKLIDDQLALQASWLRFEALNELARADKSRTNEAIAALKQIIDEFPGTQFARNAEYQLARLKRGSASASEVARDLESITKDNPNYFTARYEVCLLYHQLWQQNRADEKTAKAFADKAYVAVDRFLRESRGERSEQRLRVSLIAIDISLRSTPVQIERAKRYFGNAAAAESLVPSGSTAVTEYHYHKFQLARATGDTETINSEAQWLTENGGGTAYQKSAIVQMAKTVDQRVAAATGEERLEQVRAAVRVYDQMVLLFGSDQERLKKDKNARVALSKLASYQMELKMFDQAAVNTQKLVDVFPSDQNYLRKCGLATFHASKYEQALPHWRKLSKGLESGSDKWYEAKYHVTFCLAKTDAAAARDVYQQFVTLHPNLEEPWKSKFAEIGSLLGE